MSTTLSLRHIYNACDPKKPAPPQYYVDCEAVRGGGGLVQTFRRHLANANDYLYFLFSGHIGSGKSSELEHLSHALDNPNEGKARYFPILIDSFPYLDDGDAALEDILLMIVTELAAAFSERLKIDLGGNFLLKKLAELQEFVNEIQVVGDVAIGWNFGPVQAKARIQRLKLDPSARKRVRQALEPHTPRLLDEINSLLEVARKKLINRDIMAGDTPYADFVLLIDNLEKIRKLDGIQPGLPSFRELFIERAAQLTSLQANLIYTVPLSLARSPDAPRLESRYDFLYVLPMVKIAHRDRTPYPTGIKCLHYLIERRLEGAPLAQAVTPEALEFLVQNCGGHTRQLMSFVQQASTYTDTLPIGLPAAHKAIAQLVRVYSVSIPEAFWGKLADLDRSQDQHIKNGDPDYLAMLENLSVLEYINGDDHENPFNTPEPWYAVHPIVRELRKFKDTRAAKEQSKPE